MLAYCKKKQGFSLFSLIFILLFLSSFKDNNSYITATNQFLSTSFDPEFGHAKLKKWELMITDNGFMRMKRIFVNGKQEYFSFNLSRFKEAEYLGTETSGVLTLKTKNDDVIVQTFNDPKGNIDSMSHSLDVPLRNINIDSLNKLPANLLRIKKDL